MQVPQNLKFDANGLIPVVVQDADSGEVLMVAYMNQEAVERTLQTGRATSWSRSRQQFWVKGETSGGACGWRWASTSVRWCLLAEGALPWSRDWPALAHPCAWSSF